MIKDSEDYSDRYKSLYSTLFGLGIGFFITHAFFYWKHLLGPDGIQLTSLNRLYILIEVYLLFNYFRYLFGLRRFAEMTGKTFMPKEADWTDKNKKSIRILISNILKILVTNVGIFQLLVFSLLSMLIVPEINKGDNNREFFKYFLENHVMLMKWFFILDLALLLSDLFAVVLYNRLDPEMIAYRLKLKNKESTDNEEIEKNESKQMSIWIAANITEIIICVIAIVLLREGAKSDLTTCAILMIIKFALLLAEMTGMYYFLKRFSPFKTIVDFINGN